MTDSWSPFYKVTDWVASRSTLGAFWLIKQHNVAEMEIELRMKNDGSLIPQEQYVAFVHDYDSRVMGNLSDIRDQPGCIPSERKRGSETRKHLIFVGNRTRGCNSNQPYRVDRVQIVGRSLPKPENYNLYYSIKYAVSVEKKVNILFIFCTIFLLCAITASVLLK